MINFEFITNCSNLDAWADKWQEIYNSQENEPSLSLEWTTAMLSNHVRPQDRFLLCIVKEGSEIVGFIPLIALTEQFLGLPFVTVSPISEKYKTHSDILCLGDKAGIFQALIHYLTELPIRWDVFRMSRVLEENSLFGFLGTPDKKNQCRLRVKTEHPSYWLNIPESMEIYLKARNAKFRNTLKRRIKKLSGNYEITFKVYDAQKDLGTAFRHLIDIETNSWKHNHGTAISALEHQKKFFQSFIESAARTGKLHLSILYADSTPLTYNLGAIQSNRYFYLKTSFNENYRSFHVAMIGKANLIEDLVVRKIAMLDFPGVPYEWEKQWTQDVRWNRSIAVYNHTILAKLYYFISGVQEHIKTKKNDGNMQFYDPSAFQHSWAKNREKTNGSGDKSHD